MKFKLTLSYKSSISHKTIITINHNSHRVLIIASFLITADLSFQFTYPFKRKHHFPSSPFLSLFFLFFPTACLTSLCDHRLPTPVTMQSSSSLHSRPRGSFSNFCSSKLPFIDRFLTIHQLSFFLVTVHQLLVGLSLSSTPTKLPSLHR